MTLSAAFTVEGNANPAPHHVAFASTVDLELTSTDEATSIVWTIMGCSEPSEPIPTITPAGSPYGKTASFVMPADSGDTLGRTFLVRCVVSTQILGTDGAYEQDIQYGVIGAENSQGELPIVPGEKNYRHGTHGWAPEINRALNNSGGGGGGGGGGWTDDGAVVRLTSSSDSVAIGTASLSGTEKVRVLGNSRFEQVAATSGNPKAFYVSGAAHTALSSGAEIIDVDFALDRTVQRTAGAVTTSRAFVVRAPAYSFAGASIVTDAATVAITGAPTAGTNATLTNSYAFWVQSGAVRLQSLTAGVVVSSSTGVLSSVTGTALQVLRWNSGGTALEFANPGSSLSAPSDPADNGKVAVAASGNLTYTLLSNAHIDAAAAISLTKLASIATDRLLGRDTAGTGAIEELTASGGIEFTGSGGIQRSALTGDITAAAGSGVTAITAGVIVDADVNASAAIAFTKLATIATDSLLGRDTAGTGALETIGLNATLSMTGAGALQRAALTGDVTAAAGSNVTAIGTGVIVDADVNSAAGIAITKLGNIATDTLMGRDTAGTGAIEAITVGGGIEFTGSGALQRSAISGDITIAAGSGTAAITAGVIIDADINAAAAIAVTKLANATATSVLGRSAGTTGAYADIAAASDDHVLRRVGGVLGFGTITTASITGDLPLAQLADIAALSVIGNPTNATAAPDVIAAGSDLQVLRRSGTAIGFGAIDISSATVVGTSKLAYANVADLAALSVLGRASNTSGVMAAITGADGQVLRVSGTTLAFGTIATAGLADNSVTLAKLATQAAYTVLANATASVAVPTAVQAASDLQVFRRSGGALGFGSIDISSSTVVGSSKLAYANMADLAGVSVLGRGNNTSGVMAAISGTADQVLRVNAAGTSLLFGTLATASIADNAITLAKLATQAALTVLANATNATAVPTAVAAASDGQVFLRSGTTLTFGTIATAGIADGSVTYAKFQNVTTDRLLGRDTALTGVVEELTVTGGLEFTGSGGIQRSALTGDVTATAGSGVTAIAAGVIVDADVNASAAIAFTKLATIATDRLLGRDTASTGTLEALTVTGGLEFTGAGGIQRSALTGDVTATAGSNTTAIAAGVIVDADVNASAAIAFTKLATIATDRLLGRDTTGTGTLEALTVGGGVEFTGSGGIQRSAISGDITIAAGSGTAAITAGVIVDADINASAAIALSKLATQAALTVLANATNGVAVPTAVAASTPGSLFQLNAAGTALSFGQLQAAAIDDNTIPIDKLLAATGASVLGRGPNTAGDYQELVSSADGQVLRRASGTVGWGTLALASITGGSAVGQVLINSTGNVPVWGALDLADSDARTGVLPGANVSPDFVAQNIVTTGNISLGNTPATAGHVRVPNGAGASDGIQFKHATTGNVLGLAVSSGNTLVLGDAAATGITLASSGLVSILSAGTAYLTVLSTAIELFSPTFRFDTTVSTPSFGQQATSTAAATGQTLDISAQGVTGTGATVGGLLAVHGGNSSNGTGGELQLMSGTGATANGAFTMKSGTSTFFSYPGTLAATTPTTGVLRMPHGLEIINGRSSGGSDRSGISWGVYGTDTWEFGDSTVSAVMSGLLAYVAGTTTAAVTAPTVLLTSPSSNGTVSMVAGSITIAQAKDLSGRAVLGLFSAVTTTEMPTGTGHRALYWRDAATGDNPTALPVSGGILSSNATLGLGWIGKYGVETTIAPHGDNPNTGSKRRFVDWKSEPYLTVDSSGTEFTAAQFDMTNFNGRGLTNGILQVKARIIHSSPPSYASVIERTEIIQVTAGVISSGTLFPHTASSGDGGPLVVSIDHSGSTVRLRIQQTAFGPPTTTIWAFLEVTGIEL